MSIAGNKAVATEFFARLTADDIPGALGLMTDDGTWWLSGKRETLATAGVYDKAKLARLFETMKSRLKGPLVMTIKGTIGEGDKVAMEAESVQDLPRQGIPRYATRARRVARSLERARLTWSALQGRR
jgi:uncharacterized protein